MKLSKFTKKELKGIEKQFDELFGDNDCSGNYICTHETIDKHWTVYEDDLRALKSYISMTVYDIEKNATNTLKAELLDKMPKERPDATKQGELIPFNGKNAVEMHWLRKCQDAGYNDALDDVTKIVNEL